MGLLQDEIGSVRKVVEILEGVETSNTTDVLSK